jgi:flagellar biosynthesis/type III secretory pathway ATPase
MEKPAHTGFFLRKKKRFIQRRTLGLKAGHPPVQKTYPPVVQTIIK